MKWKNLILVFTLPLLVGFISGGKSSAPSDTPVALVKKIVKDVKYKKENVSDWEIAKTGLPLKDGEEVKTGSKSLALILFTDGSGLLRVRENAILHIYGQKENQKMNKNTFVQKGLVGFDVKKQAENEEFKFTTPTVVASIRGTGGFLDYSDDSTFTMSLDSGDVALDFTGLGGGGGMLHSRHTVTINSRGQFNFRSQNDNDRNLSNSTRQTEVKKIKINTDSGDLEINYYGNENR
ncbi:MAG: FecR domain-containing protein [Bacteroidetes bacterium]|nr:FecR domain-containing protein [Bacteroidota bacterium]